MDNQNKMLVVDDSSTMRRIIVRILTQAGIAADRIIQASSGVEALDCLETRADVGLILCDVNMPEMNGIDFVRMVRKTRSSQALPIIMITTEGGETMHERAISEGANGYIVKPFTPETIVKTLAKYLPTCPPTSS